MLFKLFKLTWSEFLAVSFVFNVFRSTSSTVDSKVIISAGIYDKMVIIFNKVPDEEF